MAGNNDNFWTVADGCAAFDISDKTLRKLRNQSGAKEIKRDGKVLFDMDAVRKYIAESDLGYVEQEVPNREGASATNSVPTASEHDVSSENKSNNNKKSITDGYTDREQGLVANMHGLQRSLKEAENRIVLLTEEKNVLLAEHNTQIKELRSIYDENIERVQKANAETIASKEQVVTEAEVRLKKMTRILIASGLCISVGVGFAASEYTKRVRSEAALLTSEGNYLSSEERRKDLQEQLNKNKTDMAALTDQFRSTSDQVVSASKEYSTEIKGFSNKLLEANNQINELQNKLLKEQEQKEQVKTELVQYKKKAELYEKAIPPNTILTEDPNRMTNIESDSIDEKVEGEVQGNNKNGVGATNLIELAEKIGHNNSTPID